MNQSSLLTIFLSLSLISCTTKQISSSTEKEIENLIKQVLIWADSDSSIELLPVITDGKDSIYIGFNIEDHKQNLNKLKATGLFATEFIENYNQIILTLNDGLKTGKYSEWLVGDLPPFIFANDYSPWWNGQERFTIEKGIVRQINSKDGKVDFYFVCGDKQNGCEGLEKYKMRFTVKEDNKWRIFYLEGFDFEKSTSEDGEL